MAPKTPYESLRYRNYFLLVMTIVYAFNFIDRQLLSILQESIKQDLQLSDTQLGLLTGTAFAMFYVVAGIPIARYADHSSRRNIVSLAVGTWSLMTALSGLASSYVHLLLARIGVGIGEAGGTPPTHSMISDVFPPDRRATAMSIYSVGINVGVLFGFLMGGFLNEYFGWRIAFVVVGLPGILLALVIRLTVVEPPRGWSEASPATSEAIPLSEVLSRLWGVRPFRHVWLGGSLIALGGYAAINWLATFFIRQHGMGTAELGVWLAIGNGVFGGIGTFSAGYLCDRLVVRDKRWSVWLPGICSIVFSICSFSILMASTASHALALNCALAMVGGAYLGPTFALLHSQVDHRMRAMASAVFIFVLNVIGLGLGPTLVGIISDALSTSHEGDALKYAMLIVLPAAGSWSGVHFFLAARHFKN